MKFLRQFLSRFLEKDIQRPLGRWSNNHCDKQIKLKVDLSNEDHCGPCGEYAIKKIDMQKIGISSDNKNKENSLKTKYK
jgi:hypothetical protein